MCLIYLGSQVFSSKQLANLLWLGSRTMVLLVSLLVIWLVLRVDAGSFQARIESESENSGVPWLVQTS